MNYVATITSKRQLTLPSKLTQRFNLKPGTKLAIKEEAGRLIMTPSSNLVEELAGSLKLPEEYKGLDTEQIVKRAKSEYFAK